MTTNCKLGKIKSLFQGKYFTTQKLQSLLLSMFVINPLQYYPIKIGNHGWSKIPLSICISLFGWMDFRPYKLHTLKRWVQH